MIAERGGAVTPGRQELIASLLDGCCHPAPLEGRESPQTSPRVESSIWKWPAAGRQANHRRRQGEAQSSPVAACETQAPPPPPPGVLRGTRTLCSGREAARPIGPTPAGRHLATSGRGSSLRLKRIISKLRLPLTDGIEVWSGSEPWGTHVPRQHLELKSHSASGWFWFCLCALLARLRSLCPGPPRDAPAATHQERPVPPEGPFWDTPTASAMCAFPTKHGARLTREGPSESGRWSGKPPPPPPVGGLQGVLKPRSLGPASGPSGHPLEVTEGTLAGGMERKTVLKVRAQLGAGVRPRVGEERGRRRVTPALSRPRWGSSGPSAGSAAQGRLPLPSPHPAASTARFHLGDRSQQQGLDQAAVELPDEGRARR